jgi:GNAT superfamily N-acetyltransferase
MMTMNITPATASDIPALCELLNALFTQEEEFKPDYAAQSRGLACIIDHPEVGSILVARRQDKIVGMVNLLYTVSTALGERVALLEDMVVAVSERGGGIGSQLIERAIDIAKLNGCRRITLLTDSANQPAQRFYAKHGFKASAMIPLRLDLREANAAKPWKRCASE